MFEGDAFVCYTGVETKKSFIKQSLWRILLLLLKNYIEIKTKGFI